MSSHKRVPVAGVKFLSTAFWLATISATLALGVADAATRGGGRGGGGGGTMAQSSVSGANRSMSGGSASNVNRANVNSANVNTANVNRANVNTANVNTANVNRTNVNTANVNTANVNRVNVNNTNVNINNNVNVNIDGGYHGGGYGNYHPIAAGVAIGAVAVTTAAVMGSYYRALPPTGCTTVIQNGVSYSHCGSVYYQQTWSGNDVVYVVVNP